MPLVYLDNSYLNLLDETLRDAPGRFADFHQKWSELGHVLAVSSTHAEEIVLSSLPDARERRYRVVRSLLPVRTNLPLPGSPALHHAALVQRELVVAIAPRVGRTDLLDGTDRYWVGFPSTADASTLTLAALVFESQPMRGMISSLHLAHDTANLARHRSVRQQYVRLRLRDLTDEPIPADVIAGRLQEFDRSFAEEKAEFMRRSILPTRLLAEAWETQRNAILGFLELAQTLGHRRAFAAWLGVDAAAETDEFVDVLIARWVLREQLVHCAKTFMDLDAASFNDTWRSLTIGDCPGYWLRHLIGQEIQCAEDEPPVSNEYDLAHVEHLPYVDYFLCDKRIANYIRQLRRRCPDLPIWRSCPPPMCVAKSLTELEEAIGGLTCPGW